MNKEVSKLQKILVTGINGLIGWHCFLASGRHRYETRGTFSRFHSPFGKTNCVYSNLDSKKQIRKLLEETKPNVIIHARSICDLDVCEIQPELTERVNIEGTQWLVDEAARLDSLKTFCYISTDHVFNGNRGQYSELDETCPKHVFGRTKVAAESIVRNSTLPWLIIRPGLAIGQSPQGNKGPRDWLFSRLRKGMESHLFTDEWRTPIWAEELADKILSLIQTDKRGLFHIAGNTRINRYELGLALARREGINTASLRSKLTAQDRWSHIRPNELTLKSVYLDSADFSLG